MSAVSSGRASAALLDLQNACRRWPCPPGILGLGLRLDVTQVHDFGHRHAYSRPMSEPHMVSNWLSAEMASALAAGFAVNKIAIVQAAGRLSERADPTR